MGIAWGDFQGAVGAVGNLTLVFQGFHGTVFSTAFGIAADHVRTVTNRNRIVQMLVNGHGLARQGVAPATLVNLPPAILDGHRVVFAHDTFGLNGEDPIQIAATGAAKGGSFPGRLDSELVVELGDVAFAQKPVGLL